MGACKAILVILLAIIVAWIYNFVPNLGLDRVVFDHHPGPCHWVPGVENGSEDIQFIDDNTALITSGLKFTEGLVRLLSDTNGQIFFFDFTKPEQPATPVQINGLDLDTFNPHGISAWRDGKGATTVFVVNHPIGSPGRDRVEVFSWDATKKILTHLKEISNDKFRVINDLVATSDNSFYITNCQYMTGEFTRMMEMMTFREWAQVLYFDGNKTTVVADGLHGANGVALSPDNKHLYVALANGQSMQVYKRLSDTELELLNTMYLGTCPDNIIVDDETGDIWIGSHPVPWQIMLHLTDTANPAPSQVLRIRLSGDKIETLEEVFSDSGRLLHGSTVAAYRKGGVLIGTVTHKLMYCQVLHLGV